MHNGEFHPEERSPSYILSPKQNILKTKQWIKVCDISGKLLQQP